MATIMVVSDRFINFILKKTAKKIRFNPVTYKYDILQIVVSDKDNNEINEEGSKYGYTKELISEVTANISQYANFNPCVCTKYNVNPTEIKDGQHFVLYFCDDLYGSCYHELVKLDWQDRPAFLVISDNSGVLKNGDTLVAITKPWNCGYIIDFKVIRGSDYYPDKDSLYRTRKLEKIEFFNPNENYGIIDSNDDFRLIIKFACNIKYDKPLSFADNEFIDDKNALFIIKFFDDNFCSYDVNPSMMTPQNSEGESLYLRILKKLCEISGDNPNKISKIRSIKPGKLEKKMYRNTTVWEVIEKPVIKFYL